MKYILCVLSLFVILMLVVSGCMGNSTQSVQKAIVKPQVTVEPPSSIGKSVLTSSPIPISTIGQNGSVDPTTTLAYGEFSSTGNSVKFKNIVVNTTVNVTPTIIVIPSQSPTPIIIIPTPTPNETPTPIPTPTLTPIPTPTSTPVPGTVLSLVEYGIKADGSDETKKLNDAFDYAKSHNYKVISFPTGGTIGLSSHVYSPANMELSGNGCTIKLLDINDIGHGPCFFSIYENSYVHNLIFDGNMKNQKVVTNGVGLYPNDRFENNEVMNVGAYSLSLYRSDNVVINNNIIHDSLQYGIGTSGEGFPVVSDYANNITITNNTIYRCGQVGIKVRQTSNSLVKGNIITMPGRYDITGNDGYGSPEPTGIRLYTFDGTNDHITITGNSITGVNGDNYEVGIESDDDNNFGIVITNNIVKNSWIGINLNFNNGIITGNSVSGCDHNIVDNGVGNIITTPTPTPIPTVTGSTLYVTDYGIKADGSDETNKLNDMFVYAEKNNIKKIIFPAGKVIGVTDTIFTGHNEEIVGNGCTIKLVDNSIMYRDNPFVRIHEGCYVHGLKFFGNMYNQSKSFGTNSMGFPSATNGLMIYDDVVFEDNDVSNVGAYSVTMWQMNNVTLRNNIIHDTWQYGIALKAGNDNYLNDKILVTGNTFYNCYQVGVKIAGASNSVISGNIVKVPPDQNLNSPNPEGITLYSLDWRNKNIVISDNIITGSERSGIGIYSQTSDNANSQIKNNKISNLGWGIDVNINNGVITGNIITNCTTPLDSTGTGNTISGNTIIASTTPTPTPTPVKTVVPTTVPTTIVTTVAPNAPVKLIFIHHSSGMNWLATNNGGLANALKANNYFVSDTHYGWGSSWGTSGTIGDHTDLGDWWTWFRGPNSAAIMGAVYNESKQTPSGLNYYTRLSTDPGGKNKIVMFKSCYPNSELYGSVNDPIPSIGNNPMKGKSVGSTYTISNAKGIYIDLLEYFKLHQDTLFVVITAPPLRDDEYADNARIFNQWLVNDWLDNYPYKNVAVFDFYNVLTTNGGSASINDLNSVSGNHHRMINGQVQYTYDGQSNTLAYPTADDHPAKAGNQKATAEFVPYLNYMYNRWKSG